MVSKKVANTLLPIIQVHVHDSLMSGQHIIRFRAFQMSPFIPLLVDPATGVHACELLWREHYGRTTSVAFQNIIADISIQYPSSAI